MRALEAEILRLYHTEHWPVGTVAAQLRVHHGTVRRVLAQAGVPVAQTTVRASMVEPYRAFIVETLTKYPTLRASRLYHMVRERGYPGAPDHFRAIIAQLRPRPAAEAYLRLRTLPGEQSQADWAHFGKLTIDRGERPLMAFVMVLSYSRHLFLRFYLGAAMSYFIRGHVDAFASFNSVPRVVLYDNLRSAVLERVGDAIRFYPTLLELAAHYRYEPRPVAPARGNEKGRVENAVGYVKKNFLNGLELADFSAINPAAQIWLDTIANVRIHGETHQRPVDLFTAEQPHLKALNRLPYDTGRVASVRASKQFRVTLETNHYSVPAQYASTRVTVKAYPERLWLRFLSLSPQAQAYYDGLEQRRANARHHLRKIVALADIYGTEAVARAIEDALVFHAFSCEYIANILEMRARKLPEPGPLQLTRRQDLLDIDIAQPDLSAYEVNDDEN